MAVKQSIPSSPSISKLSFSEFKGVDFSSSPFEVSTSRAVYSKNMINKDGVNHKRNGWTQDNKYNRIIDDANFDTVEGLFEATLKYESEIYVPIYIYCGTSGDNAKIKVVLKEENTNIYLPNNFTYTANKEILKINCFQNNGYAYLLGYGEYVRLELIKSEREGYDYEIKLLNVDGFSYTPTTVASVNTIYDEDNQNSTRANLEDANMINPKRKNSLLGFVPKGRYVIRASEGNSLKQVRITTTLDDTANIASDLWTNTDKKTNFEFELYDGVYYFSVDYFSNGTSSTNKSFTQAVSKGYTLLEADYDPVFLDCLDEETPSIYNYENNYEYNTRRMYRLDAKPDVSKEIKITLKTNKEIKNQEILVTSDYVFYYSSKSDNILEYEFSLGGLQDNSTNYLYKIVNSSGMEVGRLNTQNDTIEFFVDTTPIIQGEDNITVEYYVKDSNYIDLIKNCEFGLSFGLTGYSDRLFISGNKSNPATVYFTGHDDFTYFPYVNYNIVGSNVNPVTGFSVLADSTIAVHKAKDYKEASIYYLTAQETTLDNKARVAFVMSVGTLGESPVNPSVCHNLAGDHLFCSENGVYGIQTGENIKVSERFALERSGFVNSRLTREEDIKEAKAIVYKNRYYLAVGDNVYIADARFKTGVKEEEMNDTFNYEWWYWDNMPVKRWCIIDNHLCFLSNNDRISLMGDGFEDVTRTFYNQSNYTISDDGDYIIQFNGTDTSKLENGAILQSYNGNEYYIFDVVGSKFKITLDNPKDLEEGRTPTPIKVSGTNICTYNFDILNSKNVVSEWYSPVIDMGTNIYSKNLLTTTLVFEPDIEGTVKFGYLTRRARKEGKESERNPSNGIDFEDTDFTNLSFELGFAVSRTLKTKVRNFNYIQFRIVSENDRDCALNMFTVTYNISRKNKGVR